MRLAVLLALTSAATATATATAYAEPPVGDWTFDAAVGGGVRLPAVDTSTSVTRVAALSVGIGHMFVPDVSYEMRYDEIVVRDGRSVVGTLAMTLGCRFWVASNLYATLGFGLGIPQRTGLFDLENGGYAFAAGGGYTAPVTDGWKLTVGVGVTHIVDDKAPTTVSVLIGVLSL